jgi:hypothetical protein
MIEIRLLSNGYEINPLAYLKARLSSFGPNKITIRRENFWEADLSGADEESDEGRDFS